MSYETSIVTSLWTSLGLEASVRGEVLGVERRRRWSDQEKLAILQSVGIGGATVSQVARRHDLRRQQIYAWRSELKQKGLLPQDAGPVFLPVEFPQVFPGGAEACPTSAGSARVEVVLRNGRSLRVDAHVDVAALTQLIQTVEAA